MMGVVVNGAWPMSTSSQSFGIQNEISGGNLEKSVFVSHSSGSSPSSHSSVSGGPWLRKMKIVKRIKRKIGLGARGGESSPNNLPPLVFHSVHGENIELSCEGTIARRVNSFCNGITFSNRVVKINERVNIKLIEISQDWRGVLRFGFTSVDPASMTSLPAYSIPNLTSKPGYWAKTFDESDTRFTGLNFKKDSILFYYVTAAGNVHFGINGDEKGVFFHGVDTRKPLWALVDVYGCTTCLEFVDTRARLNNSRKSLHDFGGSYSESVGSGKHDGNELELKILSSMSSMSLRSDEHYQRQHHLHCHQRSVSCCQHFSPGPPHARQCSQYANDDDEDLFQKPSKEKEVQRQQQPALKHIDFTSCTTTAATGSNNNKKLEQHFVEDSKNLAKKEAQLYAESQLEIVCRRASLSPASFKLFNNKPSMHTKAIVMPGSEDLNHDKSNNRNNVNSNSNNNVFIAKGSNNNQAHAKNYNNINNQNNCAMAKSVANNNVYIEGPLTPAATPLGNPAAVEPHKLAQHVQCSRQRHQSTHECNDTNKVVTVAKIEPTSKLASTNSSPLLPACKGQGPRLRYSYHCATAGSTTDEEYLEQQLLLAASSPVSPASSAGSAAYVVMREVRADVEPIYTEVSGGGSVTYSNNSTGSMYSYCSGAGQSPVIQRKNSQITPIYSTAFPSGNRSNSPRKPQTPPPPPPTHRQTLPIDTSPKQSPSQKKAAASKHQWSVGCVSCYERPVNSIFHACGHMCMCYQCAFEYWTNKEGATCPICSTVIADVVIRTPPKP